MAGKLSEGEKEMIQSVCSFFQLERARGQRLQLSKLYSARLKHVEFPRGLSNGVVDLRKVADTGKGETTTMAAHQAQHATT